jgi:hypothetical protein
MQFQTLENSLLKFLTVRVQKSEPQCKKEILFWIMILIFFLPKKAKKLQNRKIKYFIRYLVYEKTFLADKEKNQACRLKEKKGKILLSEELYVSQYRIKFHFILPIKKTIPELVFMRKKLPFYCRKNLRKKL